MPKVIFVVQRKPGTTREQCIDYWAGDRHTSIVARIPGLTHWVQNHVASAPAEPAACDGVGELWFESDDALQRALSSPEMAAAVEDADDFLDMDRTGLIVVVEKTVIEPAAATQEPREEPADVGA
jgi:uncharacterized protein (TIGR02118 family)